MTASRQTFCFCLYLFLKIKIFVARWTMRICVRNMTLHKCIANRVNSSLRLQVEGKRNGCSSSRALHMYDSRPCRPVASTRLKKSLWSVSMLLIVIRAFCDKRERCLEHANNRVIILDARSFQISPPACSHQPHLSYAKVIGRKLPIER